jgi:hypothetical protein
LEPSYKNQTMSGVTNACNCSTFKSFDLNFTEPSVKPSNYLVKWKVAGSTTGWNEFLAPATVPIKLLNIPTCCAIEGEVRPYCGISPSGIPLYGGIATFGIPASATYVATLTASGGCTIGSPVTNYVLTGTPNQVVKLRLTLTQNITFDNTGSGSCAWMAGSITARGTSASGYSASTSNTVTPAELTLPSITLDVTIPSQGTVAVSTAVTIYNSTLQFAPTASIQVISVDGQTASNLPNPACTTLAQTTGCLQNPFTP